MKFETETVYTLNECRKAAWGVWLHSKKDVAFFICLAILMLIGIVSISFGMYDVGSKILLIMGAYVVALLAITELQIRKGFNTNKIMQNAKVHFVFYEDRFEVLSASGNNHIEYKQLYKMIETKENFYPMIASNNMFIVRKADCSEELIDFLRGMA